jgi:hypothetical protein
MGPQARVADLLTYINSTQRLSSLAALSRATEKQEGQLGDPSVPSLCPVLTQRIKLRGSKSLTPGIAPGDGS